MAWMNEDSSTSGGAQKPSWEYKPGIEFLTVLPNTTARLAILTDDLDPTGTWMQGPVPIWVHQYKSATSFVTVFCDKWKEACPLCFENEIYKTKNPNYKQMGGRLPMGISKRALVQVYDFEKKKVLWLLAGQSIQEEMDFILTQNAAAYRGIIGITRTGTQLQTKYRVSLIADVLTDADKAIIAKEIRAREELESILALDHEGFEKKTGINPTAYWAHKLPQFPQIDISGWGPVPHNISVATAVPVSKVDARDDDIPFDAPMMTTEEAMLVAVTIGTHKGSTLGDIYNSLGKPYLEYLLRADTTAVEKIAIKAILSNCTE